MADDDSVRKSFIFTSRVFSKAKDEMNFDEFSEEELQSIYEEALNTIKILTIENEVFTRILQRNSPQSLMRHGLQAGNKKKEALVVESARTAQKIAPLSAQRPTGSQLDSKSLSGSIGPKSSLSISSAASGMMQRTASTSGSLTTFGGALPARRLAGLKITINHRIDLVQKEVEIMKKEFVAFEKDMLKKKEKLEMDLDEMTQRCEEVKESEAAFKTEILDKLDPATQKIPADKFFRFMNNQTKHSNYIMDRLNLKIVTTKRLITQIKKQKEQQENLGGDMLRPIDFEKLTIENQYLIEENEENHRKLVGLKELNGHYNFILKNHKQRLFEKTSKLQSIEQELIQQKQRKIELHREQLKMSREVKLVLDELNYFKDLHENYEAPEVLDFLNVQRQLQEARKKYKRLCRQRKLQLFTLKSLKIKT